MPVFRGSNKTTDEIQLDWQHCQQYDAVINVVCELLQGQGYHTMKIPTSITHEGTFFAPLQASYQLTRTKPDQHYKTKFIQLVWAM